jgi:cytosine deaminase
VRLAKSVERGSVPRDDVAAVIAALLGTGAGVGATLELVSGDTAVEEAVRLIG